MHTLALRKQFNSPWPLTVGGRTFRAGYPMCLYVHKVTGITFAQAYDGPFYWVKNPQFYGMLRMAGVIPTEAARLSGWRPSEHTNWSKDLQSFPDPGKPVVPAAGAPYSAPVTETRNQQVNQQNTQLDMAKKAKSAPAAPAAAPVTPTADILPPPPGSEASPAPAPAPPVEGAPAPAPTPAEPVKVSEPQVNGITRPSAGTTTRAVWEHADRLSTPGNPAQRKAVVEACVTAGINSSTATTQFGKWAKFHGFVGEKSPTKQAAPATPVPPPPAGAVPPPPAVVDPAFQAGYDAYKRAAAGEQGVTNPYAAGTPEVDLFTSGWSKAHTDVAASAAQ